MRTKTPDTYYINHYFTNVAKVHDEYIEFRTGNKHKKRRKIEKLVFKKNM